MRLDSITALGDITRVLEKIKKNISEKKARAAITSVSVIKARDSLGYQKIKLCLPLKLSGSRL